MITTPREERRHAPRFSLVAPVSAAARSEQPLLGGHAVNGSPVGLLLAFPGPALPLAVGDRCLISLRLADGALHVLGLVRRKAPGADGRHYVGIEYDHLPESEVDRLIDHHRDS